MSFFPRSFLGEASSKLFLPVFALVLLTAFSGRVNGSTFVVTAGGDLQSAINVAQCGDTIVVQAGATFQATGDKGFVFPAKPSCTGTSADMITVRTSNLAGLPVGHRVQMNDAAAMAKLVPANFGGTTYAAMTFTANSRFWQIIGVEATTLPGQSYCSVLVDVGPYVAWNQAPSDLIFDRVYVHSLEDGTDNPHATSRIGFNVFARRLSLLNSRIAMPAGYVGSSQTVDNQYAFLSVSGPGPITIDNCFLSAWYNAFFTGGASLPTDNFATVMPGATMSQATLSNVNNLHVGDLLALQQNDCVRSNGVCDGVSGHDGYYGAVKVTGINGNTVTYTPYSTSWGAQGSPLTAPPISPGDAQWNGYLPTGFTITHNTFYINPVIAQTITAETGAFPKGLFEIKAADGMLWEGNDFTGQPSNWAFTARNQGTPHGAPSVWSTIKNITMRSNRFLASIPSSYRVIIFQLEDNYATSTPGGNILLENNLISNVGKVADVAGGNGVTFRHNTFLTNFGSSMLENLGINVENLSFKDNIAANNEYGMHCTTGDMSCFPNLMNGNMLGNTIVGPVIPYRPTCGSPYPTGNRCTDQFSDLGFVNAPLGNYGLLPSSPFKNTASDGTDPGIDAAALQAALGGALANPTPTPTATPTPTPTPTPSPSPTPTATPTPAATPLPNGWTNFALASNGSTAVGSSSFDSRYPVASSIDGDRKGRSWGNGGGWNDGTANSYPDWVEIQFPAAQTIGEVDVFTLQDNYANAVEPGDTQTFSLYGVTAFSVEYWNGSNWISVATVTGNNKIKRAVTFNPVRTTKVRTIINGSVSAYSRLVEIEAWGFVGAPTPTPTPNPSPTPNPNGGPGVVMTSPLNGDSFFVGDSVTLTANTADADGQVTKVEFFANGSLLGTGTSAPYSFFWSNVQSGVYNLVAKATDNNGASASSSAVVCTIKKSPDSVDHARTLANQIVGDFNWAATSDDGAGSGGPPNGIAVVGNLDTLAADIQQAYNDFTLERNWFSSSDRIADQLLAAYYFAKADAALAGQLGTTPSAKAHLQRVIGHLTVAGDLMRYGSVTPGTIQLAFLVNARLDVTVGTASTGLGNNTDGLVSPASLASVVGSAVPLTSQTAFATPSANNLPFELNGVSAAIAGVAVRLAFISPSRVTFFAPANLPAGDYELIVITQSGYVSKATVTIAPNVTSILNLADGSPGPAVALNDAKQSMPDLSVTTEMNLSDDKRTRLTFFATGISGSAVNSISANDVVWEGVTFANFAESVTVEARTEDNRTYNLPVEFAGGFGTIPGLDQINVVLIPELEGAGTVNLTLMVNGRRSNPATIFVR